MSRFSRLCSAAFEQTVLRMDPSLIGTMEELEGHFAQSAGQMVSSLSMDAVGWISGIASSLPGLFIELLLMIITTFFIAADYDKLTGFCLRQMGEKPKGIFPEHSILRCGNAVCVYPLLRADHVHHLCGAGRGPDVLSE